MKVGVIHDTPEVSGGAELSLGTLLAAAPDGVECYHFGSGDRVRMEDVDVWVVGNCTEYTADGIVPHLRLAPVVKRVADYWENGDRVLRDWILQYAHTLIFSSPMHVATFEHPLTVNTRIIPPPVDVAPFIAARSKSTKRSKTCWIGHMKNPQQKGVMAAVRWAQRCQEHVDFYGENAQELVGTGDYVNSFGPLPYDVVPNFMAGYKRFLFLPQYKEPFGRTIIEALAAGCEVVTNAVPGCMWYLETDMPQKIETAADDFWQVVTEAANVSDTGRVTAIQE